MLSQLGSVDNKKRFDLHFGDWSIGGRYESDTANKRCPDQRIVRDGSGCASKRKILENG